MSAITQCPECGTRFKVSQEQLDAHQGMVRCGRCQAAFNALEHLHGDAPSPQLALPIEQAEPAPAAPGEEPPPEAPADETPTIDLAQPLFDPDHAALPEAAAETVLDAEPVPQKKRAWPWLAGSALLLLLLLAQAMYFFRVELASQMPGLKPLLSGYCSLLQCSIPLPQNADLMSIESSDLEADPAQANLITLSAVLRNHAAYAQAYPSLELTLNDANDKPIARRTFRPSEYLQSGDDEKSGLAGRRELNVKLALDTTTLKPSGYRLLLYYAK